MKTLIASLLCIAFAGCGAMQSSSPAAGSAGAPAAGVIASVPIGRGPTLLAISPDGSTVYAASVGKLFAIRTASNTIATTAAIDQYTTGIYYGGVLVGLRIPISRCVDFTFDPSHLAMPTPSLFGEGFPFYYGQWRLTLGIEARL